MGSGTNRKWWREQGSRTGRRSATKSGAQKKNKTATFLRVKARRAEAKRRAAA